MYVVNIIGEAVSISKSLFSQRSPAAENTSLINI